MRPCKLSLSLYDMGYESKYYVARSQFLVRTGRRRPGPALSVESQVERLALGQGGLDWREVGEEFIGLDDAAVAGSLQPSELDLSVNISVGT